MDLSDAARLLGGPENLHQVQRRINHMLALAPKAEDYGISTWTDTNPIVVAGYEPSPCRHPA
jgi:hypothetical protein